MNWELIAKLLGAAVGLLAQTIDERGNDATKEALSNIRSLVNAIHTGDLRNIDPATAQDELDKLLLALMEADHQADAALTKRFDDGGDG